VKGTHDHLPPHLIAFGPGAKHFPCWGSELEAVLLVSRALRDIGRGA
jgi:hypothetical protein